MTVWPEHTSVSRRENTMRSSCKPDRYFPRSAVEAASNRPGWSELAGEKNTVFLNVMRSNITATPLPWFGTGYLYLHSAYVFIKGMLGESWRKQELGRLTAAVWLLAAGLLRRLLAVTGLHCACVCQITTIQVLLSNEYNFLKLIIHGFASVMILIFSVQMWQIVISLMTPQTKQFNATDRVGLY